jgi:hypothetical protein
MAVFISYASHEYLVCIAVEILCKAVEHTDEEILSESFIFEKAKMVVTEKGWDSTEEGKKVLGRFLNVEKQLLNKLSIHGVKEIPIEVGALVDDFLCIVCDTEPDMEKENDTIIGIEKKGYTCFDGNNGVSNQLKIKTQYSASPNKGKIIIITPSFNTSLQYKKIYNSYKNSTKYYNN